MNFITRLVTTAFLLPLTITPAQAAIGERGFNGGYNTMAEASQEMCIAGEEYKTMGATREQIKYEVKSYAQWLAVNHRETMNELIKVGNRCAGISF